MIHESVLKVVIFFNFLFASAKLGELSIHNKVKRKGKQVKVPFIDYIDFL